MIGREQKNRILDRDFKDEDIRVLGEPLLACVVTYESGQLRMVPDMSVECYPGQEFIKVPGDLLVINPVGVVSDPDPNEFYVSIDNQEGLHYLLCCDVFPERDEFFQKNSG
jgi:hypothetical protein